MIVVEKRALEIERSKQGLSKSELAEQIGVSHSVIVRAEQGKSVSPKTASLLCDFFNIPFDSLFTISDKPNAEG